MASFSKDDIHEIDRYLLGHMSPEEAEEFEARMENKPELKREVEVQHMLNDSIRLWRRAQLKKFLSENASSTLTGNIWGQTWTKISIGIFIVAGLLVLLNRLYWAEENEEPQGIEREAISPAPEPEPEIEEPPLPLADSLLQDTVPEEEAPVEPIEEEAAAQPPPEPAPRPRQRKPKGQPVEPIPTQGTSPFAASVRSDYVLGEKTLPVISAGTDEPVRELEVELWQSMVNFEGYKLSGNELQLYGFYPEDELRLVQDEQKLLLITNRGTFRIAPSSSFQHLQRVDSKNDDDVLPDDGKKGKDKR